MFGFLFNTILYQPLLNFLILLYKYLPGHDFGVAIIVLTILVKILLYPLGSLAIRSQKSLSEIQPKLKEIQEKYKDDKERQVKETMALYKREKINPFSGFVPLLVQLPVLIALYRVFWQGLQPEHLSSYLYNFLQPVEGIKNSFFGVIDLSRSWSMNIGGVQHYLWSNIILIVLVGVVQFWQTKMLVSKIKPAKGKKSDFSDIMQKQMQYVAPVFIVLVLLRVPAAVSLYLLASALFSIVQQYIILNKKRNG